MLEAAPDLDFAAGLRQCPGWHQVNRMQMIDIYTHILPDAYFEALSKASADLGAIGARLRGIKPLFDLDLRFRQMDAGGPGYQQINLVTEVAPRGYRDRRGSNAAQPRGERSDGGFVRPAS